MEEEKYIVIGQDANGIRPLWVGMIGNRKEVKKFLKSEDLDYVWGIFECKNNGQQVDDMFLIIDEEDYTFTGVKRE